MQFDVEIGGRRRRIVITSGDGFAVDVDGQRRHVDAARIDAQTVSLIIGEVRPKGDSGQAVGSQSGPARSYEVALSRDSGTGTLIAPLGLVSVPIALNGRRRRGEHAGPAGAGPQRIVAPMPGKIVRVLVQPGQAVHARQPLVVVEAMKMENELRADRDGTVTDLSVHEGDSVEAGALLVVLV